MGGLRLLLDVEQYNYMKSSTTAAGIFVLIQNKAEAHQLVRNMAYSVSAGFHTNIALRYNKVFCIYYNNQLIQMIYCRCCIITDNSDDDVLHF